MACLGKTRLGGHRYGDRMDANFEFTCPDPERMTRLDQADALRMLHVPVDALPALRLKHAKIIFTFEIPDEQ